MQVTSNGETKQLRPVSFPIGSVFTFSNGVGNVADHKEKLHGAYLAYTQGDAHENPKPEKGGGKTTRGGKDGQGRKRRSGEEKNPGEETTAKKSSAPAADTRPAL